MQRYIADVHKDLTPQQRAGKFTALLKKFVYNSNMQKFPHDDVHANVDRQFVWMKTPEGHNFWAKVNGYSPNPIVVEEQPRPEVPALVWPKGATHYRPDVKRFFNKEGQFVVEEDMKWYLFHSPHTYGKWTALPQTIKRPETPLPNGLKWPEGFDYHNVSAFEHRGGFFFNQKQWGYYRGGELVTKEITEGDFKHYEKHLLTQKRYPDNQPVIFLADHPGARIIPRWAEGRRGDEPVPRAPVVENVAAKAPVEPPKAQPEVKKPVGWWK